jgi:hypothetical protein
VISQALFPLDLGAQKTENRPKGPWFRMGISRALAKVMCGLLLAASLAACATVPPTPEMVANNDP